MTWLIILINIGTYSNKLTVYNNYYTTNNNISIAITRIKKNIIDSNNAINEDILQHETMTLIMIMLIILGQWHYCNKNNNIKADDINICTLQPKIKKRMTISL